MVIPETEQVNPDAAPTVDPAEAGLRPIMTLLAATLQATSLHCQCKPCLLLQAKAGDLVPLITRMAGGETA